MTSNSLALLILIICLFVSFILSGMEAGVFALNRLRVRRLARAGRPSAKSLNHFLENTEMEKVAQELARGRSAQEQQQIYESQRHYEQALVFNNRGDFEKAKIEAARAVYGRIIRDAK